jgi:hypothetical protein
MPSFDVDTTDPASLKVTVGGRRQKGVARVAVDHVAGQGTQLFLTFAAGGRFVGEGDVYIAEPSPRAVAAFLDRVSPAGLERAALAAEEASGGPMSPGVAFLAGLRSMLPAEEGD